MVQLVIRWSDMIEHAFHLYSFCTFFTVWLNMFLRIIHKNRYILVQS